MTLGKEENEKVQAVRGNCEQGQIVATRTCTHV